ncbi:MAG: phosphoglycerate mutase, partial [Nitrososphaerales archaeon]
LLPTVGHRVVLSVKASDGKLSANISNTDPAYAKVKGMGVAKPAGGKLKLAECKPLKSDSSSKLAAKLVNEFTKKSLKILGEQVVNRNRKNARKMAINCILLRDAGNRMPRFEPINKLHGMTFCCIVDMPVERGIAKITNMRPFEAGDTGDYEQKAKVAAKCLEQHDAVYVHIKGPDEFGHDGDARGKKKSIEEIDRRFFGPLLNSISTDNVAIAISGDHSTPCIKKGHSDDPVPLLVSGKMVRNDSLGRFTESYAAKGTLGMLNGYEVLSRTIQLIRS